MPVVDVEPAAGVADMAVVGVVGVAAAGVVVEAVDAAAVVDADATFNWPGHARTTLRIDFKTSSRKR
ncbi:MAG: hypothetical protein WB795_06210 [Candidatus Acidiferrales bacterium]